MSTVVKDLGAATAYGYAVEKGYTGTEAEFAELMASYATVGQTAVTAAQTATTKASEAATSATTATTKASEATTAATTATTKAGEASTSASTATSAKDTAVSASQTATTKATEATTAAATATSAKTDAVAANAAAQSAKTAAQTAQTGAETAAASVSASAEQIATNAADISQLKSDLTDIDDRFVCIPTSANILDTSKSVDGYLNVSGIPTVSGDWKTTPFVDVSEISYIWNSAKQISSGNRTALNMYFLSLYDSAKAFISQGSNSPTKTDIAENVAYIRYSYHANDYTDLMIRTDGNYYNDYVPYTEKYELSPSDYVTSEEVDEKIDDTISGIAYKPYKPFETTITSEKMLLANGNIIDYSGYSVTDYIDLSGHSQVKVTGASNYQNGIACFYNESKTFMSCALQAASGGTNTIYTDELVNVPSGAKYLVVSGKGNTIATAKGQFDYELLGKWHGIKWLAFGDSLTDSRNSRATKRYFDYIQDATDITVINGGVSGSGYCVDGESAFGTDTNWHDRILTYNNTDFDVITFFGSFNDMSSGLPNGSVTDTGTATKAGCINTTLDNLFSFKPLAIVGVVTPTPWQSAYPTEQYAEAYVSLLKEICNNRGIPCLDLFHESLLRPWDATFRQLAYSRDDGGGTHPDENGHKMIAPRFEAFLDSLLFH